MTRGLLLVLAIVVFATPVRAADLYRHDSWSALASDQIARKPGDTLTVLVFESAAASNSASTGAKRSSQFGGRLSAGSSFEEAANLKLDSSADNRGMNERRGGMVAQISVVVDDVLPNGDLHISGAQFLNIDGEETKIRVKGRVRPIDISASNTVLSSRIADAAIDYDGSGFVSRSARPGLLTRLFNWLGLP